MRVKGRGPLPPRLHFKWGSGAAEPPPPGEDAVGSRVWVYVRPKHKCYVGRVTRYADGRHAVRYGDATEQSLDLCRDLVVPHESLERMLCPPQQRAQRLAAYHTLAAQLGRAAGERPAPFQVVLVAPALEGCHLDAVLPLELELGAGLPELAGNHESPPGAATVAEAAGTAAEASPAAPGPAAKGEAAEGAGGCRPSTATAATPRCGGRVGPASPQLFTPAVVRLRAAVDYATGTAQE